MIDPFWTLLAAKMATTAGIVVAASLIVERSGPFLGAMVATLPISAGPAYVFLAVEHGDAFIERASLTSLAINAVTLLFSAIYVRLARRHSLLVSLGAAVGFWLLAAGATIAAAPTFGAGLALNVVFFAVAWWLTRASRADPLTRVPRRRWWDVPFRACLVMALVGVVVGVGRVFGPAIAGVAALVPIVMTSLAIILQPRIGGQGAAAVYAHALPGLAGFGLAVAALHATALRIGAPLSLLLALAICVGWNVSLALLRRVPLTPAR
jgi:hypothetical protein